MLFVGPFLTGGIVTGSALGKVLADVVFYIVAIICYEAAQRRAAARRRRIAAVAIAPSGPRFAAVVAVGAPRPRQGSTTGPG
ncbi:hypothetical protein [Actinoplanes utahensis]|nr:hypothetical protein [Actinoplanes utahensis]